MIGHALCETIKGMESVTRIRRRHDPSMMRLVQILVYQGVVQASVDPVNEKVGEDNKERELEGIVPPEWGVGRSTVQLGVSSHFTDKKWDGKDGHNG